MKTLEKVLLNLSSLAVTTNSDWLDIQGIYCGSVQHIVTGGAPAGTAQIQVSNDYTDTNENPKPINPTNLGSAFTLVAGTNMTNLDGIGYRFLRVAFTTAAGTGTLKTRFFGKGS